MPRFDVPYTSSGQPTVRTIVERIQCEMREMVVADDNNPASFHRLFLLDGDYDVAIALSLEVNDTGGLAPSFTYLNPFTLTTGFTAGGAGALSESRDHNFTENIQLSYRQIFTEWRQKQNLYPCPDADTNLSGTLGLKDFVAMAALTPNLDEKQTLSGKGVFGGSVQFVAIKNLTSAGPTWTLVHFAGPGSVNLSQVNTDKITLAFAKGPNAGKPMTPGAKVSANQPNKDAYWFLQQLLTSSINQQLNTLQNNLFLQNGLPALTAPR